MPLYADTTSPLAPTSTSPLPSPPLHRPPSIDRDRGPVSLRRHLHLPPLPTPTPPPLPPITPLPFLSSSPPSDADGHPFTSTPIISPRGVEERKKREGGEAVSAAEDLEKFGRGEGDGGIREEKRGRGMEEEGY